MVSQELLILTGVSLLLAIAIGANDETFAPATGAKLLSINRAVIIGAFVLTLGAVTVGYGVATEVGTGLSDADRDASEDLPKILTILISVALLLVLGSWKGLPLSTTHTMVGSTVALALILDDPINEAKILKIVFSWFVSPILGFIGSYLTMK
ncbi:MAG: inorganic phosphate transporter, partial [Candidatus Kariarchaeaceae archaeon]